MVEFTKDGKRNDVAAIGELLDFFNEMSQKKFSGVIEVQLRKGEPKSWIKTSKFKRLGGATNDTGRV